MSRSKTGLEILFARPEADDHQENGNGEVGSGELRERYWIRIAEDTGIGGKLLSFNISMPHWIERHEIGRHRTDPGDGFRYVYRWGNCGMGSGAEWFEVTEVFEGVEAKGIDAFMRINNGRKVDFDFDSNRFLSGLEFGIPCRAAQQRGADQVIAAVKKKMNKRSYKGMNHRHGYGTLIVGLPLWYAMYPKKTIREENVIDDFQTRLAIGLKPYIRRLKKKTCPFWRIVIIWVPSLESVREWCAKTACDDYDDPAYRKLGSLPVKFNTVTKLWPDLLAAIEVSREEDNKAGGSPLYIYATSPKKQHSAAKLKLPPVVDALKQALERDEERCDWEKPLTGLKWRVRELVLNVLCFVRVFGLLGFERWLIARLSPRSWISKFAMRFRAFRLYRASLHRRKWLTGLVVLRVAIVK